MGNNECGVPCRGDSSEEGGCGGPYAASTYVRQNSTFIIPSPVPSVGLWQGLGCYKSVDGYQHLDVDCGTNSASLVIRLVLALFSEQSTLVTLLWSPALPHAKLRDSSSPASNSAGNAVSSSSLWDLRSDGQCVLTNDDKGVVQSFSTVQRSLATTMALNTGSSAQTQTLRTATWVVKETQPRRVAGQPC